MSRILRKLPARGSLGQGKIETLFDTGASVSLILRKKAAKLGQFFHLGKTFKLGDGKSRIQAKDTMILALTVNKQEISDQFWVVDDLNHECVIGASTMQLWGIVLDLRREDVIVGPTVTEFELV